MSYRRNIKIEEGSVKQTSAISLPILYFGAIFFPPNFGAKLVSITFYLRPEGVLLVLTVQKLAGIHV